ncbi:MAG: DUF2975 domain-containing protein [Erythrobacter sp.]
MTMRDKPNDLLLLAGKVLTILAQAAMGLAAAAILIAIPAILFFSDKIDAEIAAEVGAVTGPFPVMATVAAMAIGLVIIALIFVFFGKLRAIISTVGEGDPFVPENADRLNLMAWLLLGTQLAMIPAMGFGLMLAKWADEVENAEVTIDAGLDIEGILMVIVLFILARVFKHGAAMREDLEGTV